MQRNGTVLIALLAVVALAAAAGGFTAGVGGPLTSDTGLGDGGGAPDSGPAPSTTAGGGGGSGFIGAVGSAGSGGGSVLLVAGFVGALVCAVVLVVALTGDDERAPRPESDARAGPADPRPAVEVRYRTPEDTLVVRAWDRLAETVGRETTETPGETAHRAAADGFSRETVQRLAEGFRAVRYGGQPPEGRERAAREALDEVERKGRATAERGDEA